MSNNFYKKFWFINMNLNLNVPTFLNTCMFICVIYNLCNTLSLTSNILWFNITLKKAWGFNNFWLTLSESKLKQESLYFCLNMLTVFHEQSHAHLLSVCLCIINLHLCIYMKCGSVISDVLKLGRVFIIH